MSSLKKILAMVLAVITVLALGACSSVPTSLHKEYSYKTDKQEYPVGMYIFSLYSAYDQARSILSENLGDKFDSTASIMDIESTFDETGEVYVCKEWIKQDADRICRNLVALDAEIEKYGITLDPEIVASARDQAKDDWYLGPYYEYSPEYSVPYKDVFEPFGISFDSFFLASASLVNVKQSALFNYFYNKGGTKAVPEADVKAYFEKEYTSYSYFTINLFTSTVDESGATTTVPVPEVNINEIKSVLDSYYNLVEDGTEIEKIGELLKDYAGLADDPILSNTELLDNSSLPDDVVEVLEKLPEGKAQVVYTGNEDSQIAYFVYKEPIKEVTDDYLKEDTNYTQILMKLKGEEFVDYLYEITDTVECQVNKKYIDKCDPKMFETNLK